MGIVEVLGRIAVEMVGNATVGWSVLLMLHDCIIIWEEGVVRKALVI